MGLLSLLYKDPVTFLLLAGLLLYSVIAHEVAHGLMAYFFGDDTAKRSGRLTLAPLSHLSPIGTLMLFLAGFGWAKPVPVNFARLSHGRLGLFSVSLAGCATNILIATVAIFLYQFENVRSLPFLAKALPILATINIMLGAFNLIPIPPLDGSKVLMSFLPENTQRAMMKIEPYGFFILLLLLFTGLLNPIILFMRNILYILIGVLFRFFHLLN